MNVIVQSKTMVVTEALRSFVVRQARKLDRRRQRISSVIVFLEAVKRKKNDVSATTARFLISVPGKTIVVQERAQDLYLAISQAARGAIRQVGKAKERRANNHKGFRLART